MKRVAFACIWFAGLAMLCQSAPVGQASDQPKTEKKITIYCPIVGLPGVKTECGCVGGYCSLKPKEGLVADHGGGKVRFCCAECLKTFKKSPAKFAIAANHQLVATKQARQVKCPHCGGDLGFVPPLEINEVWISFKTEECRKVVAEAKPGDRATMVFGDKGFARGFAIKQK